MPSPSPTLPAHPQTPKLTKTRGKRPSVLAQAAARAQVADEEEDAMFGEEGAGGEAGEEGHGEAGEEAMEVEGEEAAAVGGDAAEWWDEGAGRRT